MLKEHSSFVKQIIAAVDCVLLAVSFYCAKLIVDGRDSSINTPINYFVILLGFMIFYLYFAWTRSLFSIMHFNWMAGLFKRIVAIFFSAAIVGAAILFLLPDQKNSRYFYLVFAAISFTVISCEKYLIKCLIIHFRRNNYNTTPIIIVGRGRITAQLIQEIRNHSEWGFRVIRKLDLSITPEDFEEVLKNYYVEEVFFCIPRKIPKDHFLIDPYLQICEEMGRPARVFLNLSSATYFARWEYHRFMNRSSLISHTVELDPDQIIFKRIFDIFGGIIGFGILAVLYPFLAVIIKLTSPGPVFFKQVRVGKNGKRFILYKFRSMRDNAESMKVDLMKHNELDGAVFKMKNDPRVTTVGKFMRKFSLDEFPQVINVLKGEMSLVGTRPPTPEEVANYKKWHHRRISIRPGMTGLWQVSGRNRITTFDDIVKLDLSYIDHWSIWLDIKIIFKTFRVLFQQDSAF